MTLHLHQVVFISIEFSRISYFNFLEFKEFNKTIIIIVLLNNYYCYQSEGHCCLSEKVRGLSLWFSFVELFAIK